MKNNLLGTFEEYVLLIIGVLGEDAYGVSVRNEIKSRLARNPSIGALHSAFYRLEDKGFISSNIGGATAKRGGRRKRYYQITNAGKEVLIKQKNHRTELYQLLFELK